jgi:hypothetical protein
MIERIRLGPRCPMNRAGALPVGRLLIIILLDEWKLGPLGSNVESESSTVAEHDLPDIRTLRQLLGSEVNFGEDNPKATKNAS